MIKDGLSSLRGKGKTTYGDGEFGGDKKKGSKICSLSGIVPGAGIEPNFKTEDFHNMLEVIDVVKPYLDL